MRSIRSISRRLIASRARLSILPGGPTAQLVAEHHAAEAGEGGPHDRDQQTHAFLIHDRQSRSVAEAPIDEQYRLRPSSCRWRGRTVDYGV